VTPVDRSVLPTPAATLAFRFPRVYRHVLANGLEVRAVPHHNVPVLSSALLVRGGTASDPADRPGLAAFTADLLDEGSAGKDALEVSEAIARLGADLDVDVGPDAVVVSLTSITRFMAPGLELLAEIVTVPNLEQDDFERVRKLRLERLTQLRDHAPAVAERAVARLLYRDHPYGHLGLGTEAALAATELREVRGFHAAAYVPSACTLVIAGDAPHEELIGAAETAFGSWSAPADSMALDRQAGLRPPPLVPEHRLAMVPRPGSAQSELRIAQVCASRDTPDYHALVLLNMILGGQFVSRVNLNLRQDKGYTYGVRTGFDLRRGLGPFMLQTSVQTEVTAAAAREALHEIEDLRDARPATPEEIALARASITRGYPRGFETAQQVSRGVAQLALHGLPDTYFEEFVARVDAVSENDISRVAAEYLDTPRMLTLIVGDQERVAATLPSLNLGEPYIVPAP
jgi:predicted Zn-dependent peptidase